MGKAISARRGKNRWWLGYIFWRDDDALVPSLWEDFPSYTMEKGMEDLQKHLRCNRGGIINK